MKTLLILLLFLAVNAQSFWGGNNANWSPFGSGTGYNNTPPWGSNSNWNPFVTNGRWGPNNDAANLSRYGVRPKTLTQYRKKPRYVPIYPIPVSERRIKPSNWLTNTDFASTMQDFRSQGKNFIIDEFPLFLNSTDYAPYKKQTTGKTDNIYRKQGYSLSPAASSTQQIDNK